MSAVKKAFPAEDERTLLELVAYDDVFSLLKNGASMLWGARHAIFPQLAPIVDNAISKAKDMIASISGGNMSSKLKNALISDHSTVMGKLGTGVQQFA